MMGLGFKVGPGLGLVLAIDGPKLDSGLRRGGGNLKSS